MKKIILILATTLYATNLFALGLFLDPHLGYRFGSESYTIRNLPSTFSAYNGDYKYDISGYDVGAKIGLSASVLNLGVDYRIGSLTEKVNQVPPTATLATTNLDEYDSTIIGVFAGVNLPLIRGWLMYLPSVKWKDTNGTDIGDELSGKGFGVGAGLKILPLLSLNIEYLHYSFDEEKTATQTYKYPDNEQTKPTVNEFILSVSLPISL